MQSIKNISYAPSCGERGWLDLFLPDGARGRPIVVVIHGGGLRALSKERMIGVSEFIVERGWVAVNINYRLLSDALFRLLWRMSSPLIVGFGMQIKETSVFTIEPV